MPIIRVERVCKFYALHKDRPRSFQEIVVNLFRSRQSRLATESFWALQNISFSVEPGEMLGIIGSNGSGKSTLLKLLTRIIEPTSGQIAVNGRVSALLELGAGFHPELTGRENIFLYGSVLGLKRREMEQQLPEIIAFAELERFIDVPVKFYSSGMYVRLAFAVATSVRPEILLVDEVLAVGDRAFQDKCLERVVEMSNQGITIVIVSHDLDSIRRLCSRVIWLDKGLLRADGKTELVVNEYLAQVLLHEEAVAFEAKEASRALTPDSNPQAAALEDTQYTEQPTASSVESPVENSPVAPKRWGTMQIEIMAVALYDHEGKERLLLMTGEPATVVIRYKAHTRIEQPVFGLAFFRSDGTHMSGSNTQLAQLDLAAVEGEGEVRYHIDKLPLLEGSYLITAAIHNATESEVYDYQQCYYPFQVRLGRVKERYGLLYIPGTHWQHISRTDHPTKPDNDEKAS